MTDGIHQFKIAGKINSRVSAKMIYMLLSKLANREGGVHRYHRKS
ncbi:hypothetical protein QBE53_12570 [Vallitaleaceae bacterium 9-2]